MTQPVKILGMTRKQYEHRKHDTNARSSCSSLYFTLLNLNFRRGRSRSPIESSSPRCGISRSPSYSRRSCSYSRSRSQARRGQSEDRYDIPRSPAYRKSSLPSKGGRKRSLTPDEDSPCGRRSPCPRNGRIDMEKDSTDYSPRGRSRSPVSPRVKSRSPVSPGRDSPIVGKYLSSFEDAPNGKGSSPYDRIH